jgi:anti-sigma factor RsiW
MRNCDEIEPLFAPYVDGEVKPQEHATVHAHLEACPRCRERVAGERAAREVLRARREGLKACASEHLRRRCAAQAGDISPVPATVHRPGLYARRTWIPLSLAATLLLAVTGVFIFGLNNSVEALAAQLALDHMKCFQFAPEHGSEKAQATSQDWLKAQGWAMRVPPSAPVEQLELLGVRRCLSTEGITAHLMYRWRGKPLSLYVIKSVPKRTSGVEQLVERLGQEAVIWSEGGQTYAVVARGRPVEVHRIADYVRRSAH